MDYVFDWTHLMQKEKKQDNSISSGYASSDSNEKRNNMLNSQRENSFKDSTAKLINKNKNNLDDPNCTLKDKNNNNNLHHQVAENNNKSKRNKSFSEWFRFSLFKKSSKNNSNNMGGNHRSWFSFKRSKSNIQLTKSTSAQNLDMINKSGNIEYGGGFYSNTLQPKKTGKNLPNRHNSSSNIPAIYGSHVRPGGKKHW